MSIERLTLTNILSFGPGGCTVQLGPLNVLIGPNGSGKSNLVDVIGLLQALPADLVVPLREGGGAQEWGWKGATQGKAQMAVDVRVSDWLGTWTHELAVSPYAPRPAVTGERISIELEGAPKVLFDKAEEKHSDGAEAIARRKNGAASALAYRRDIDDLSWLAGEYDAIRIYRDLPTGRNSAVRLPQRADHPDDFLMPGGENLALILSSLQRHPKVWDALQDAMRRFHPSFHEVKTVVQGGTIQIFIREKGLSTLVSAARLSDGTLKYLALLCVLLHPRPPSTVCIEEPELGLHPDLIGDLAKHLVDASTRTQLIVTTHSDHLINALSDRPEAVLVTSRDEQGTHFERLDAEKLKWWLERYSLGELWLKGEIGGTRW